MPTLMLRFPGRRYHATPWGHHVNEGLIEWPPSPWRLLRALLSTGYTTLGWEGTLDDPTASRPPADARSLIEKLASVLPRYSLPPAVGAHSRHYMPLASLKRPGAGSEATPVLAHLGTGGPVVGGYKEDTTLVFDTWADVGDGLLEVTWDCELNAEEAALLERLAAHLSYLGRAESRVEAWLQSRDEPRATGTPCIPCGDEPARGPGWEQVALMAPLPRGEYAAWRETAVAEALAPFAAAAGKLTANLRKKRETAEAPYPPDLIACLQVDVTWLRSHGWSQPPGTRRILYWRRMDALEVGAPRGRPCSAVRSPVEGVLLAMASETGNDHALPSVVRTLPQAELLHRALVGTASRQSGHSFVLSGCTEDGSPSQGGHRHAHVIPLDLDADGHLDHMLIWAPSGLDGAAQDAIRAVRRTFTKGGVGLLKLALVAFGSVSDLRRLSGATGERLRAILGPEDGETTWVSATPFVAPRHVKSRGRNALSGQVAAELASRGLPDLSELRVLPLDVASGWHRFRHFVRRRRFGPAPPVDCAMALHIELTRPTTGPIALGYGSHYGLGLLRRGSTRL